MGGAKFMGRDYGTNYNPGDLALGIFFIWTIGGLMISFVLSVISLPKPNIIIPFSLYIFGLILLFIRYLRIEKKDIKNE